MIHETIVLREKVTLTTYIHDQSGQGEFQIKKRPAVINPDAIILMGFSAGACLAAMSATQWNTPGLAERLGLLREDIRPNAGVIAYAPWDNSNTIQKDPEFYNPEVAKIAKDCTPELDFINYAGWQGTV